MGDVVNIQTRASRLDEKGLLSEILWHERYPEDHTGDFARERRAIERESVRELFDRWLRGHNIVGYAGVIMAALDGIREACGPHTFRSTEEERAAREDGSW